MELNGLTDLRLGLLHCCARGNAAGQVWHVRGVIVLRPSYGTLLPNLLFGLPGCEHPLPSPPGGPATLRGPVDRRGAHPEEVGDGGPGVAADLQGEVGQALAG